MRNIFAFQNCKGNSTMTTIVNEELVSFKELEKKIYSYVCELGREITQTVCGIRTMLPVRLNHRYMSSRLLVRMQ